MSNGFQFFEGSTTINSTSPQATLRRSGQVILTAAAVELLGDGVTQVQVGYNAKTGAVGIRPAVEGGRGALRPQAAERPLPADRREALLRPSRPRDGPGPPAAGGRLRERDHRLPARAEDGCRQRG